MVIICPPPLFPTRLMFSRQLYNDNILYKIQNCLCGSQYNHCFTGNNLAVLLYSPRHRFRSVVPALLHQYFLQGCKCNSSHDVHYAISQINFGKQADHIAPLSAHAKELTDPRFHRRVSPAGSQRPIVPSSQQLSMAIIQSINMIIALRNPQRSPLKSSIRPKS